MNYYSLYFSPTGGTKKVADTVAEGWGEEFTGEDLIKSSYKTDFCSDDLCLISVPSFGGRVPAPAAEKLSRLHGNGAGAVLIAVFGNRAIDDTLLELSDLLVEAGFRPVAAMEAVARHSLVEKYGAGRPDAEDCAELKEYANKIRSALENNTLPAELKLPGNRPYREFGGVPLKPTVVSGKGTACGRCAEECPTGAIPKNDCKTTDTKKCISCMHCVAVCPNQARKLSKLMVAAASQSMKASCSGRKPNKLSL